MSDALRIAIDGPAGAGKSTAAKILAERLGYTYVDTGAIYRALTLTALRQGVQIDNEETVARWLQDLEFRLILSFVNGQHRVIVNDEDVTALIRSQEVNDAVTVLAQYPAVREYLLLEQRRLASQSGVVMDGRDIGTVIMPNADVKFFLTASLEERAKRRQVELVSKGVSCSLASVKESIAKRDKTDANRAAAPLTMAKDAILVDTTDLSIEEVVDQLLTQVKGERVDAIPSCQDHSSRHL